MLFGAGFLVHTRPRVGEFSVRSSLIVGGSLLFIDRIILVCTVVLARVRELGRIEQGNTERMALPCG